MDRLKKISRSRWLNLVTLGTFVLGLILGFLTPGLFKPIAFIGTVYVRLLKLLVIPLLMTQIIGAVSRTAQGFAGRIGRTVLLFIVMFIVSFCLTAVLVGLVQPGRGVELAAGEWDGTAAAASVGGFFESIIPDNIFAALSSGSILPCILFAFAVGLVAASLKAEKFQGVISDLGNIFSVMLDAVMLLTPIGVFSLIGSAAADYGSLLVGLAAKYIALAWIGSALITLLVMILPVWIYCRINPFTYIRRVCRVWLVTLSTCSSAATLPTTVRVCNEEFGIPAEITDVVVPLGCTIHMCGGAVSFCLLGMFTLQMTGTPVTAGTFILMLIIATLMNMAAPGIPGGGIALGASYLTFLGAPTVFIGLYSGFYRLLDMAYTTVNVTGDITANLLLHEREKRKTAKKL